MLCPLSDVHVDVNFLLQVLRPYSNISNLIVWDYYITEDLAHGPSFDVELVTSELRQNTDMLPDSAAATADERRVILNSCYDNLTLQQPDFFRYQFRVCLVFLMLLGPSHPTFFLVGGGGLKGESIQMGDT